MAESDQAYGDYKVRIPNNVHRAVRHLPFVVAHCEALANHAAQIGGQGWKVIVQNDPATRRPRAYFFCDDPAALHRDAEENTVMHIISALRSFNPGGASSSLSAKFEATARAIVSSLRGGGDGGSGDNG